MSESPAESAGSQSTADVDVESRLKIERTENAHRDSTPRHRFEDEDVGARFVRNQSKRRSAHRISRVGVQLLGAQPNETAPTVDAQKGALTAKMYHGSIGSACSLAAAVSGWAARAHVL